MHLHTEYPDDYNAPIHQSLIEPLLFGGCPRSFALLNGTLTAAIGLGLQQWYFFIVGIILHCLGAFAARIDPEFFDILLKHVKEKSYLEP